MNDEFICEKLKKIIHAVYGLGTKEPNYHGSYARVTEDGLYTFGTRSPLTRNTITKRVAIFLILNKLPNEENS